MLGQVSVKFVDCIRYKDSIKAIKEKFDAAGIATFEELESLMRAIQFGPTMNRFKEKSLSQLFTPSLLPQNALVFLFVCNMEPLSKQLFFSSEELIRGHLRRLLCSHVLDPIRAIKEAIMLQCLSADHENV